MDHVAIMNPAWKMIPKIIDGEKTIESRWYQTKRDPWDKIKAGDVLYLKDSGKPVTAIAKVSKVEQFEIKDIDDAQRLVKKYGKKICLVNTDCTTWGKCPKYCILVYLTRPALIARPFLINKEGFGNGNAWLCVDSIQDIKA
jgi:ASC-1-like (ASCH) protein